ncbi:MAG: AAA family ATPase [Candidatus Polarisedimenticolaceae bacterium]|nr:AAA family ATPase [Candidatus Polarisedimenticolaceae bacterium]
MNIEEPADSYSPSDRRPADSAGGMASTRPSQFFTYPELTQCLDLIHHLTENSKLIPLIKGPQGSGKTTLLFQLQSQTPEHWMLCRIDANPMMHPEQLYSLLAQHFGITEKDDQIKQQILNHFEQLQHDGTLPVIAVDDAHLLPIDTIAELLQLHLSSTTKEQHLLHLVLFAAPAIDNILQTQEAHILTAQAIQTLDMPPLNPEQAAAYITQVLLARGALEAFALTAGQMEKIIHSSQGSPGQIENLLTRLPAHPATPQKPTERSALKLLMEDLPVTAIVSTLGLISIILLLLLFQDEINAFFYKTSPNEAPADPAIIENSSEITLKLPHLPEPKAVPEKVSELPELPPYITPVEELEPISKRAAVATAVAPPTGEAEAPPEIIEELAPPVPTVDLAEAPTAPAIAIPEVVKPVITPVKPPSAPRMAIKPPAAAPAIKATPKLETVKKEPGREAWLLAQKPTAYTLQIIGLTDHSNIPAYIKRHKLAGQVAYFKTSRNGKAWYPLLYGIYPDRAAAIAARPKLASQLRQKGIWARSLESVHKEIEAAK